MAAMYTTEDRNVLGCQVFGFQPKGNNIATVGVSQNHFRIPLVDK